MEVHNHAIIVIKNEKNEYLNYYDNRWNSYLFLNCKLHKLDEKYVIDLINNKLDINNDNIKISLLTDKIHTKYSQSSKTNKKYHHYFYKVDIKNMPKYMFLKEFDKGGILYKWFTINELENDDVIKRVNSDIVEYVKMLNI